MVGPSQSNLTRIEICQLLAYFNFKYTNIAVQNKKLAEQKTGKNYYL